jgi:hypothetical protein
MPNVTNFTNINGKLKKEKKITKKENGNMGI